MPLVVGLILSSIASFLSRNWMKHEDIKVIVMILDLIWCSYSRYIRKCVSLLSLIGNCSPPSLVNLNAGCAVCPTCTIVIRYPGSWHQSQLVDNSPEVALSVSQSRYIIEKEWDIELLLFISWVADRWKTKDCSRYFYSKFSNHMAYAVHLSHSEIVQQLI